MKIVVNRALCDGNGDCARAAPELIVMSEDDEPQLRRETCGEEARKQAVAAVNACPKHALSLEE